MAEENQNHPCRRVCTGILILYAAVMLWLLFFQRHLTTLDYWTYVKGSCNLHPFQTLRQMISLLHHETFARFALVNLVGNIVMFLPLGLLPAVWPKQQRFRVFFLTVAVLILMVEVLQLFTTLGTADIDDWICNVLGGSLGFFGCRPIWTVQKSE